MKRYEEAYIEVMSVKAEDVIRTSAELFDTDVNGASIEYSTIKSYSY